MFHWTPEKKQTVLDMAITGQFSTYEIAEITSVPRHYVRQLISESADTISQERTSPPISEITENSIIDLFYEGQAPDQIAAACGCTAGQVRRVILIQERDEWDPEADIKAGVAHLALLAAEHPNRMYEEDLAAVTEYVGQGLPMRGRTLEAYLP